MVTIFGLKPCWPAWRPEGGEVRRDHHAGDDLGIRRLEGGDLRREIVGQRLVAAGIGEREAGVGQRLGEAELRVAPGIAVGIVGEQAADLLGDAGLRPTAR